MELIVKVILTLVLATGTLSQYAPGKAQRTITVRQTRPTAYPLPTELYPTDGYIAVLDCSEIGNVWTLRFPNSTLETFLVIDCAGDTTTRKWMIRNNIIGEVDYETALRHNSVGYGITDVQIIEQQLGFLAR